MPNAQLTNPKGAGYFDAAIEGGYTLDFEIDTTCLLYTSRCV